MPRPATLCSAAGILLLLGGCVVPPTGVAYTEPAPGPVVASYPPLPAPRAEVVPPPPPRQVVAWQPGHWHWNGYSYEWLPGRYVERIAGTSRWVPGHWVPRPGGYGWVAGHWA